MEMSLGVFVFKLTKNSLLSFNIDSLDPSDKPDQDLTESIMVLSKPADAPVQKLFDLGGKVVAITGR